MINFNFTLSDEDAEMLFDCVQSEIIRIREHLYSSQISDFEKSHLKSHIDCLNSLKEKMHNCRV